MKNILGLIQFNQPLLCRGDVLGNSYMSTISGVNIQLHFPELRVVQHEDQVELLLQQPQVLQSSRPDEWGRVFCYNTADLENFREVGCFVFQVVISSELDESSCDDDIKKIISGINAWRTQLHERVSLARKNCPISTENNCLEKGGIATGFELYIQGRGLPGLQAAYRLQHRPGTVCPGPYNDCGIKNLAAFQRRGKTLSLEMVEISGIEPLTS